MSNQQKRTKSAKIDTVAELEARVKQLESENNRLKDQIDMSKKPKRSWNWLKNTAIILFISLSVTSFMFFNISAWVRNTVTNTDVFVETMQPLLKDKPVQERIKNDITTALFDRVDVETELQNALPENIAFLSAPLADQIKSTASDKVGEAIASDQVYDLWGRTLYGVHDKFMAYINNENADGVITVNEVYAAASNRISQDSKLGFLTNKQLPPRLGSITLAEITWLPQARSYIHTITVAPLVFLGVTIGSFLLAILLSVKKRRTALTIVGLIVVIMLSTLAALKIGLWEIEQVAKPANVSVAKSIFTTISSPLEVRTAGYAALFTVIFIVLLAVSNVGWITKSRRYLDMKIMMLANKFIPKQTLPKWLTDTAQHITAIAWSAFILLFVLTGLRFPPEYPQVRDGFISAIIAMIVLYAVNVYIRATTRK